MAQIKCSECGKVWTGKDEHDAEVKQSADPCPCQKKYEQMNPKDLLALLKKRGKA